MPFLCDFLRSFGFRILLAVFYEKFQSEVGQLADHARINIQVIKSERKSLSLEIKRDGQVILRAPYWITDTQIQHFLRQKSAWIKKHLAKVQASPPAEVQPSERMTKEELHKLAERAAKEIPPRVAHFAPLIGVTYGRITIRNQKSRWGSCSSKGNLNFNCLLMLTPREIVDYVVVHELCHRKEMNHSRQFWAEVERILPDYRQREKWLKEHGPALVRKMTG